MRLITPLALLSLLGAVGAASAPACPPSDSSLRSSPAADANKVSINFKNAVDEELGLYWLDGNGAEIEQGTIQPLSDASRTSYVGHAFRIRRLVKEKDVLLEYKVPERTEDQKRAHRRREAAVHVVPCGAAAEEQARPPVSPRAAEFAALLHPPDKPCVGTSDKWSCVRYLGEEDLRKRDPREYGLQPDEVSEHRAFTTVDTTYVRQINSIPRVTDGPGYAKMSFTEPMRRALSDWYFERRNDSMITHDTIPGGYTNNDKVLIDKIDLDRFRTQHGQIVREMREILQWWTGLRLKHTSTFGVRVYRRGSMLIDHVDRMDTHLASAVIQIHQEVDEHGGWPLEVLLPNRTVGEVYTQPGEIILYEGAWLRHGRPMRFRGNEFANVFSHFSPPDWQGPRTANGKAMYYGVPDDRLTTLPDYGYAKSTDYSPLAAVEAHDGSEL